MKEAVDLGYNKMKVMFRNTIGHLVSRIKAIKLGQVNAKIDISTLKVIFISTYDTSTFWLKIVPTLLTPSWFLKLKKKLRARKRASERG
ncbi:hypothetical protein [Sulfuricurvum sp.]|uniref:hypothetical protein n=1 Tax=Sulfuricurvum sp. TaxID=2025608 RepID=UPI0026386367|nr:hypothetical protein [Sulfuricurvum sp.]MDD3597232.1 hypothetical protein [Sulfuricurvum sp.]MDD4882937.1 hypothetical protein [Sulfuricurvum sp.]